MSYGNEWALLGGLLVFVIIIMAVAFAISILFCLSLYKGLQLIPENKLDFPAWFAWMILIPVAGVVFIWLTVFNVSNSFARATEGNAEAQEKAKSLFGLGLAYAILSSAAWIPYIGTLAGIPLLVIWIIYWVKVVDFRRHYLETQHH